ncbi:MAG TPA: TlyA family RNA methyltransferase [Candidatus Limnocylindria bacterium]|nr:TlyA family RNA methyltransferase [Candidatus Limnocylindria bacterium]
MNAQKVRIRLDDLLVERGLAADRARAGALLMGGRVRAGEGDGARLDRKPGELVDPDLPLAVVESRRYVSRGGEKLEAALDAFSIALDGRVCLDVGASTGGFTDCLLRRGAARVYALDVGRGQLAESLRTDPRVVVMERTHAARLAPDHPQAVSLPEPIEVAVIDVSFIALARVLPGVAAQLVRSGDVVALVKPQFELPAAQVPKGVVRDEAHRLAAVAGARAAAEEAGFQVRGQITSPLRGPAGNVEYLLHLAPA